jgi:hypothetical protein
MSFSLHRDIVRRLLQCLDRVTVVDIVTKILEGIKVTGSCQGGMTLIVTDGMTRVVVDQGGMMLIVIDGMTCVVVV